MNGKGDRPRKVNQKRYNENHDRTFGKRCPVCGSVFGEVKTGGLIWCVACHETNTLEDWINEKK